MIDALSSSRADRPRLAAGRARAAHLALADCQLCAHHCGANRLADERGRCGATAESRIFSAQVEVSDELEFIPSFAIAFSGCDLRCAFCITGASSWNAKAGRPFDPPLLASQARAALAQGARSVMILGGEPTIHLPSALELVSLLPASARLIWKTNAHGSAQARESLSGLFDVWLADYKFGNDDCARRLAGIERYNAVVQENLRWAARESDLVVRHLLMPGHLECCWRPVATWIAENLPGIRVNLRAGFWPAWKARRHVELHNPATPAELTAAWAIAKDLHLPLIE